jgi:ABC-type sugar transport system ATPase subunit
MKAEVYEIEPTKPDKVIHLKIGGLKFAATSSSFEYNVGETIWTEFKRDKIYVFDKKSGKAIA